MSLVLPDCGYTRYDPYPRVPGTGSGFLGTDTVQTVIPVSPSSALAVTRGQGRVVWADGSEAFARDLNLRAHAQAQVCIYGRNQGDVVAAHQNARKDAAGRIERQRRPQTLWIAEGGDKHDRRVLFTGYSVAGVRKQWFDVDPRAYTDRKPVTPEDLW